MLKPDFYAKTIGTDYEDQWFLEIDCDTETMALILEKCGRYIDYMRTGAEQRQNGVFPYVVWITPSEKRKNSIIKHIHTQYPRGPDIFIVILPDELESLVVNGAAEYIRKRAVDTS